MMIITSEERNTFSIGRSFRARLAVFEASVLKSEIFYTDRRKYIENYWLIHHERVFSSHSKVARVI